MAGRRTGLPGAMVKVVAVEQGSLLRVERVD
jgi:hypothetical protein